MDDRIDLDAYLARIGHTGPRSPTFELLSAIQLKHPGAIPFESLDPLLGRGVRIDAASVERKLVRGSRGGYCFEHNGLLLGALRALGFSVTPLAARVRWMLPEDAPPTAVSHMLLKVDLQGSAFLVDVGFGGQSPTAPLRMDVETEQQTPHGLYRVTRAGDAYDLQFRLPDRWGVLYQFTLEPRLSIDYEVFNWFTSTHPQSRFTNNLVASRVVGDRRINLFNTERTEHWPDGRTERRVLASPAEIHRALTEGFGIDVQLADIKGVFPRLPQPA